MKHRILIWVISTFVVSTLALDDAIAQKNKQNENDIKIVINDSAAPDTVRGGSAGDWPHPFAKVRSED
jgi:hypothetical protein